MPKQTNTDTIVTTAPAALESRLDAIADAAKDVLPDLQSRIKEAELASDHRRHAQLHRLLRAMHDFVIVAAEPRV
jgi:hypothetical protein